MAAQPNEYPLYIQSVVPLAIATLINFIHVYDSTAFTRDISARELLAPEPHGDQIPTHGVSSEESEEADARRDAIAEEMWQDYQAEMSRRGM